MAYTEDGVRSKLSTLNETQESIVTVAQFLMFPRRQQWADKTANLWLEKIKDSNANKRLNLIYLANELVQQSKARKRDDFLLAFSPLMPEATAITYKVAHGDVRAKVKRVVEVWRQRNIFDEGIQAAIEARLSELEKTQSSGTKRLLGGSLFSGSSSGGPSAPEELKPLVTFQEAVNRTSSGLDGTIEKASTEYTEKTENVESLPPPVQSGRYNALLKSLALAERAVSEGVQARKDLLVELEKLVTSNRERLERDEASHSVLSERKKEIEEKRREVEDAIMKGLASVPDEEDGDALNSNGAMHTEANEPRRPVTEELTPPPVENITPVDSPEFQPADVLEDYPNMEDEAIGVVDDEDAVVDPKWNIPEAGADLLASLSRPFSSTDMASEDHAAAKRQRTGGGEHEDSIDMPSAPNLSGLFGDVDELIRSEGRG